MVELFIMDFFPFWGKCNFWQSKGEETMIFFSAPTMVRPAEEFLSSSDFLKYLTHMSGINFAAEEFSLSVFTLHEN